MRILWGSAQVLHMYKKDTAWVLGEAWVLGAWVLGSGA